ncbi:unnamed protein product [Rotaria sp. Silwood2]|nr:unnamed protein product [Rotaria sp. Silwood2]
MQVLYKKITFKTSTTSLKEVLLYDEHEQLKSSLSHLVTGRMIQYDTGMSDGARTSFRLMTTFHLPVNVIETKDFVVLRKSSGKN